MVQGAESGSVRRPSRGRVALVVVAAAAVLTALLGPASPARASETFYVDTTTDAPDTSSTDGLCQTGAGECSLRAAVEQANASAAADTIVVPPGVYALTRPPGGDDPSTGDLDVTAPLTIVGGGVPDTVVDANDLDRILEVHPSANNVTLSGLTLRNGSSAEDGGALYSATERTLRLDGVTVADSSSEVEGGGIYSETGTLVLENGTTVSGNEARGGGGVYGHGEPTGTEVAARVTLTGATVTGNTSFSGGGGVSVDNQGVLTVTNSTITGNETDGDGGGIQVTSKASFSLTGGTVADNTALGSGGGIYTAVERPASIRDVTVTGNSAGELGGGSGGGLYAGGSGPVTVSGSTFSENSAVEEGGGIHLENTSSVDVSDSTISDNTAGAGGGIENAAARVTLSRLTITGNEAARDGGGIESQGSGTFTITDTAIHENVAENGGGFSNNADGTLRMSRSTIWGNRAMLRLEDDSGLGGGIYGLGDAAASYENVTISGNLAQVRGGGLYIDADADVHVSSTTIAHNTAPAASGVGGEITSPNFPVQPSTSVIFSNTIVAANNLSENCTFAIGSLGGNVDDGDSCYFRGSRDRSNARNIDLDAIADNGGLTMTMALRPTSTAIDGGVSPCATTDQRGVTRPQNTSCDSGAFEYEGPFPPADTTPPDTEYLSGPFQDTENTSAFTFTGTDEITATEDLIFECRLLEFDPAEPPEPPDPTQPPDPAFAFVGCPSPWQVSLIEEGFFTFEVRAIDRAGNVDPTPAVHEFEGVDDVTPPIASFLETPPDPSYRNSATFTFGGTDDHTPAQYLEIECRVDTNDPELWLECTNPLVVPNLTVGDHFVQIRATDGADNIGPVATFRWTVLPAQNCDDANITLLTDADVYVDQESPLANFAVDPRLVVRSAPSGMNARTLVRFPTHVLPAGGCTLERATLRLNGEGDAGRTLEAVPASGTWSETGATWNNQPGTTGSAVATTSGAGYREWNVTDHVAAMLADSAPNHGWVVRDAQEGDVDGGEQSYRSREDTSIPSTPPQLVLRFGAAGIPQPPAPEPAETETTVTCGQVLFESTTLANDLLDCLGEGLVVGAPDIVVDLNGHTVASGAPIEPGEEDGLVAGIRNSGHANVVIRGGTVRNYGYGVRLMGGAIYNVVEDMTFRGNVLTGVELYDADNGRNGNIVRDSDFRLNGDGVAIMAGSENSLVENNSFTGNLGRAVYLFDSSGHRIVGNTVSGDTGDPLLDSDGGVYLEASTDNEIVGNTVADTGDAAFLVSDGSHRTLVQGNDTTRTSDSAVSVGDSDDVEIVDNVFHQAGGAAINVGGSEGGLIARNDVRFNPGAIQLGGANGFRIEDNDARFTLADGIVIESGLRNVVTGNVASHTRATGIAVDGEAVDAAGNPLGGNTVEDNDTTGNLGDGIAVSGAGHTVTANRAYNNSGWGIDAAEGTIDGGGNLASGNAEPDQCTGVVCAPGTPPDPVPPDVTAPDTVILSGPANGASFLEPSTFTFTGTDDLAPATALRFECRLDAPPDPEPEPPDPPDPGDPPEPPEPPDVDNWRECGSPHTHPLVFPGLHKFEVRAIDPFDNVDLTPATYEWTVTPAPPGEDLLAPETMISQAPSDPSTSTAAVFRFRGSDNITPGPYLTYECRLDNGAWGACTSPTGYTGLSLGEHTFQVRAVDAAGKRDGTPATHTWTIELAPPDTTPPDTTIDSGPDLTTVQTTATFTFSATEAGSTFQCDLDGGGYAACTSPHTVTVGVGSHALSVRATDVAGNTDPSPATYAWTVTAPPVATIVSCGQVLTQSTLVTNDLSDCPENGLVIGADSITIDLGGSIIDGTGLGAGVLNDGFDSVTIRNGTVQEFDSGVLLSAGTALNIVDGLELMLNQLAGVRLTNADDGTSGNTLRSNLAAGNLTGIELLEGTQNAHVHDNSVSGGGGAGIVLDHSSGNRLERNDVSGTSDAGIDLFASSSNTVKDNVLENTADEALVVEAGSNGNRIEGNSIRESDSGVHVLDSDANEIVGNVAHGTSDNGITLENAHGSLVLDNDVRFNGTGIAVDASSGNRIESNDASESGTGIEVGDFSFSNVIRANVANANDSVGISIGGGAPGGSGNLLDGNSASANSGDGIYVGAVGHMIANNSANTNDGWGIYAAQPTPEGVNVDGGGNRAMGNVELEQCYNVRCDGGPPLVTDPVPPDTSITHGPDDPTTSRTATFRFSGSDNATPVTFECRLDSTDAAAFAPCTSPVSFTGLALGAHTFEVRATDWSGNVDPTPDAWTWTIEPKPAGVPPETTIDSGPDLTTVGTSATFTFSSNEEDSAFECRIDGLGAFVPCTSPQSYGGLTVGPHTFEVRAIDDENLPDPTPALYEWTIVAAPVAATVSCGQVLTQSTLVTNNLENCPGDGLVIGAHGITVDLGGRMVDGTGLGAGVRNNGFDHVSVTNGVLQEFDYGVALGAGTTNAIVSSVHARVNQDGGVLLAGTGAGTTVRTSTVVDNTVGVVVNGGAQGATVRDNVITGNAGHGVWLEAADDNVVQGNLVTGSSEAGVAIEGADDNLVAGNTLSTNSGGGVSVVLGSVGNRVEENTVSASGSSGILVEASTGTQLLANTVSGSGGSGIEMFAANGGVVRSNDVRFNAGGIDVGDSSDNLIRANNASGQSGTGISLEGVSLRNQVLLNTASGNSGEGVYVAGSAATGGGNTVDRNTTNNNSGNGISVNGGGHTIKDNTADFNDGWGMYASESGMDGGGNRATGNSEPAQCFNIVCLVGTHPGAPDTEIVMKPPNPTSSRNATFTFTGTDDTTPTANLDFECRLDSTSELAWVECENPHLITGLAPGTHTFEVRAMDAQDIVDPTPASYTWTYVALPSGVAPDTFLDLKPAERTPRLEALFTFSSDEPDVTFECQLDAGPWQPCQLAYEVQFEETEVGPHTFRVRATDFEGNTDPTPAVWNWTITGVITTFISGPTAETTETTATIDFAANVEEATYICSLDLQPFVACTPPVTYTGLLPGEHMLRVVATDVETGVEELEPAEYAWEILPDTDVTPPEAAIIAGPADGTSGTTFSFTGTDDQTPPEGLTFECSLNDASDAAFLDCVSPYNLLLDFPPPTPGEHTFYVRAIDREDNVGEPVSWTWTAVADTVEPGTTVGATPALTLLPEGADITFAFTGSDNGTPTELLAFECSVTTPTETIGWFLCDSPYDQFSGMEPGDYSFQVRSLDLAGNVDSTPSTWDWTVVGAPTAMLTSMPTDPTSASTAVFEFTSDQAGSTFECSFNTLPFAPCTSPYIVEGLGAGQYTFAVQATNVHGLTGEPVEYQWVSTAPPDTTPPDTTVESGPTSPTTATTASFTFGSTELSSTFECALDGAGFTTCQNPHEVADLAKGEHTLEIRARDAAGNVDPTPATWTWTVLGSPVVTITSGPAEDTELPSATFEFTSDESGTVFDCWLDGVTTTGCTSPVTYTGLGVGEHTFAVRGTANGLTNPAWEDYEWTVLPAEPPQTTITSGPAESTTATAATFVFAGTDNTTEAGDLAFECSLDGAAFTGCASPVELTGLSAGSHTFAVRAADLAGNTDPTPAAFSWTVTVPDTTPPETTVDSGPTGSTTTTSASFAFSANESDSTFECRLNVGAWDPCTSPKAYTGLTPGPYTFEVRSTDPSGNVDPTPATRSWTVEAPPACTTTTTVTLSAARDSWVDQGSPSSNKGSDSVLKVMSKSGSNLRAIVGFTLPAPPEGCVVDLATLRLNAASSRTGRTLQALQVTGSWTESGVTWGNQPATTGPAATTQSGSGWREWSVSSQVQAMYAAGNGGSFLVRDASEGNDHEQQFRSRENGSNPPQLVVRFAPPPAPPAPDTTPPDTTITSGPGTGTTATFAFASNESGSTFECSLDGAPFTACTSPQSYPGLAVGSAHSFQVRAIDGAGNVDQTPASSSWTVAVDCGSPVTVTANRDAWVDQSSTSQNKGTDSVLKVRSKSGNQAARAVVGFSLPAAPSGCAVDLATLRLFSDSAVNGRTLQAIRLSGSWTENGVTWANQPGSTGTAATTTSGTGWREWTVTGQVQAMYGPGANHGFLIRDAVENNSSEQSFHSREKGSNLPQLVVRFSPSGG